MTRRGLASRATTLAVVAGLLAFSGGLAYGALTILSGTETAGGSAETASEISWLTVTAVSVDLVPGPAPPAANTTAGAPSVLPAANQSYLLGAGTVGHNAVRWNLTERGASASTEVEVTVTYLNATSGAETTATAYLETGTVTAGGPFLVSLYLDEGTGAVSLAGASIFLQQCGAVGSCP